jgi:hypothetical protein
MNYVEIGANQDLWQKLLMHKKCHILTCLQLRIADKEPQMCTTNEALLVRIKKQGVYWQKPIARSSIEQGNLGAFIGVMAAGTFVADKQDSNTGLVTDE